VTQDGPSPPGQRLVDRSVIEFIDAVGSATEPVPAGGSVAALTAAGGAALLALVCGVLRRHQPVALEAVLDAAQRLRQELLDLVDEDAAAFRAFLDATRADQDLEAVTRRVGAVPLQIARASLEIIELSYQLDGQRTGSMAADVRAARHLANASLETALDIANENLDMQPDEPARSALREVIGELQVERRRVSRQPHSDA